MLAMLFFTVVHRNIYHWGRPWISNIEITPGVNPQVLIGTQRGWKKQRLEDTLHNIKLESFRHASSGGLASESTCTIARGSYEARDEVDPLIIGQLDCEGGHPFVSWQQRFWDPVGCWTQKCEPAVSKFEHKGQVYLMHCQHDIRGATLNIRGHSSCLKMRTLKKHVYLMHCQHDIHEWGCHSNISKWGHWRSMYNWYTVNMTSGATVAASKWGHWRIMYIWCTVNMTFGAK